MKDGKLLLTGSERIGIYRGIRDFFDALAAAGTALPQNASLSEAGCLNLAEGLVYTKDYGTFVTYEEFGAKGDGKTDDADALVQAHAAAKERKLPLLAKETATYYIGGKKNIILISTDTDWSRAHFIIDDTKVEDRSTEVFKITFEYASQAVDLKSLKAGQQNIGITFDYPVALTVYNDKVKQYIREEKNQNDGSTMRDIVLVDKEGNVDPTTPILWDFDSISSATARRVEEMPLTVKGGVITTVANKETDAKYYYRGILIYRSNVIFDGLEHYVEGEGATGAPYYGILIFHSSMNCTVKNVTFTAHKTYTSIGTAGQKVSNGTYDLTVTNSANFTALNCTQTTDINNGAYWGVFASNYSRNILFDGFTFSRFDAHCGVCNATLRNCELGHQGINLIGHGTALIENCTVRSQYFINLRSDYGSTWDGDLIILGCTYIPKNGASCDTVIVNGSYNGTHDFGYTCHLLRNIVINGLYVDDSHQKTKDAPVYLFANINPNWNSDGYTAAFPMTVTESVTAKNLVTARGKAVEISPNKYMFKGLEIQYVI